MGALAPIGTSSIYVYIYIYIGGGIQLEGHSAGGIIQFGGSFSWADHSAGGFIQLGGISHQSAEGALISSALRSSALPVPPIQIRRPGPSDPQPWALRSAALGPQILSPGPSDPQPWANMLESA